MVLGLASVGAALLFRAALVPSSSVAEPAAVPAVLPLDPEAILRPGEPNRAAQALQAYRRALSESHETTRQAELLVRIGLLENILERRIQALESFQKAQQLAHQSGAAFTEAMALACAGVVFSSVGRLDEASESYGQALEKWRKIGSRRGELRTLQDLARFYLQIGEPARSFDLLEQARKINPHLAETLHLSGMAFYLGGYDWIGLQTLQRALDQARIDRNDHLVAAVLADIGSVALFQRDANQAAAAFNECLRISIGKSRPYEAYARAGLGRVLGLLQGHFDPAMVELNRADKMFQELGEPSSLSIVLAGKALVERERGNLEEALRLARGSMELIEAQRREVESPQTRATLLGALSDPYEIQIDVLWRLSQKSGERRFVEEAFEASEKIRARTLYEGLVVWGTSNRPETASLLREHRDIIFQLRTLEEKKLRLSARSEELSERAQIDSDIRSLLEHDSALLEKISRSDSRSLMARLRPLSLPQVQDLLESGTALLVYTLGRDQSFVWWIEKESISMRAIEGRAKIEKLAGQAHALLAQPDARGKKEMLDRDLDQLSELLLAPVADKLPRVQRLVIVPDGGLQSLPFTTLPVPGTDREKLVASHVLVTLPSPSTLAALRRREEERTDKPDKLLAAIIDPVFGGPNDPRLPYPNACSSKSSEPELPRLKETAQEAEESLKGLPPGKGRKISDFEAAPEIMQETDLRRYRYLHLGAHGFADPKHPELSGIALSKCTRDGELRKDKGLLRFYDVYSLDLPVELVSLSTCRSAEGPLINREGPITMTRSFFYAGASRVLGTLWDVDDKSAAELTAAFYKGVLHGGKTPAEALRDAQNAMRLKGRPMNDWGAFVLQGDWR